MSVADPSHDLSAGKRVELCGGVSEKSSGVLLWISKGMAVAIVQFHES